MPEPVKINLWQLYAIINSDLSEYYSLREFFWEGFIRLEKEELEDMGVDVSDYDNSIIREVIFEIFAKKVINKIINNYNGCKDNKTIKDWFPDAGNSNT